MARQVQCRNCKNKFDKENLREYGKSKRLCCSCYKSQQEMDDLKEFICKFYNMDYVSPKLQKQIKLFKIGKKPLLKMVLNLSPVLMVSGVQNVKPLPKRQFVKMYQQVMLIRT